MFVSPGGGRSGFVFDAVDAGGIDLFYKYTSQALCRQGVWSGVWFPLMMISPWLHCYWIWSVWAATPTRETGFGIQSTTVLLDCGCECPSRLNLLISPLTWRTALVTSVALRMVGCSFASIQLLFVAARGRTARWFCLRRPVLEVLVAHCTWRLGWCPRDGAQRATAHTTDWMIWMVVAIEVCSLATSAERRVLAYFFVLCPFWGIRT